MASVRLVWTVLKLLLDIFAVAGVGPRHCFILPNDASELPHEAAKVLIVFDELCIEKSLLANWQFVRLHDDTLRSFIDWLRTSFTFYG